MKPWDLYTGGNRRVFLVVLFLVGTSNYVDRNIIGVLLEPIKQEFLVSDTMLGLLSGLSFALFYATLGIPVARWADRGDRKTVITVSLSVWSLMTVLCGWAGSFWQLMIARFGVGAGEAGAIPPAQSLLADYYPPAQRARAIGVFMMSSAAGYVLGLTLGGFIAEHYGWRMAFVTVGLAGIVLAPLTHFVLKEPRHALQLQVPAESQESLSTAIRGLLAKPAYRYILSSTVAYFFMAYGALVFTVSLMIRLHGESVAEAGTRFGAISAVGAILGNWGGGALADRLAARDLAWLPRLAGWGMIAALPLYELAFWASDIVAMTALLVLSMTVLNAISPPLFSALHVVCGSRRRALAVSVVFFFANLIGLGLGPLVSGALSDLLAVRYGSAEGLRFALMIMMSVLLAAGWLMLRATRYLKRDAED